MGWIREREGKRERERKKIKRLTRGCLESEGWRRGRGRDKARYIGKEESKKGKEKKSQRGR